MTGTMSAIGPKQTSPFALHMSALGGKGDINAEQMSAFDHKRHAPARFNDGGQ